MPVKISKGEKVLHVPIDEQLFREFKAQAARRGVTLKEATGEALRYWTGYHEYLAKEERRPEVRD